MTEIALGAALMAISAWISLPIGEIAVTLQVLALFLLAGLLRPLEALVSVGLYLALGLVGLPVFSGFRGGIGVLFGPTGGYLMAMLPAVLLCALLLRQTRKLPWLIPVVLLAGVLLIDLGGTLYYTVLTKVPFARALTVCVVPFLLPDGVKILIASLLLPRLVPLIEKSRTK